MEKWALIEDILKIKNALHDYERKSEIIYRSHKRVEKVSNIASNRAGGYYFLPISYLASSYALYRDEIKKNVEWVSQERYCVDMLEPQWVRSGLHEGLANGFNAATIAELTNERYKARLQDANYQSAMVYCSSYVETDDGKKILFLNDPYDRFVSQPLLCEKETADQYVGHILHIIILSRFHEPDGDYSEFLQDMVEKNDKIHPLYDDKNAFFQVYGGVTYREMDVMDIEVTNYTLHGKNGKNVEASDFEKQMMSYGDEHSRDETIDILNDIQKYAALNDDCVGVHRVRPDELCLIMKNHEYYCLEWHHGILGFIKDDYHEYPDKKYDYRKEGDWNLSNWVEDRNETESDSKEPDFAAEEDDIKDAINEVFGELFEEIGDRHVSVELKNVYKPQRISRRMRWTNGIDGNGKEIPLTTERYKDEYAAEYERFYRDTLATIKVDMESLQVSQWEKYSGQGDDFSLRLMDIQNLRELRDELVRKAEEELVVLRDKVWYGKAYLKEYKETKELNSQYDLCYNKDFYGKWKYSFFDRYFRFVGELKKEKADEYRCFGKNVSIVPVPFHYPNILLGRKPRFSDLENPEFNEPDVQLYLAMVGDDLEADNVIGYVGYCDLVTFADDGTATLHLVDPRGDAYFEGLELEPAFAQKAGGHMVCIVCVYNYYSTGYKMAELDILPYTLYDKLGEYAGVDRVAKKIAYK